MHTQHLPMIPHKATRKQGGFINVLLVLVAGIGALALTAVGMHAIRSVQDQQTSLHANTQSVTRAWDGVEVVRRYLSALSATELQGLQAGALTITGLPNVTAAIVSSSSVGTEYRVVADVTGSGIGTNATVRVTFAVTPSAGPPPNPEKEKEKGGDTDQTATLHINGDLKMTGGIEVLGANRELWVSGNVDLGNGGGADIKTISKICAGGNISIGSSVFVNEICTNGNLTMTGGATAGLAQVKGSVILKNYNPESSDEHKYLTSVATLKSNGDVSVEGGVVDYLETQGNVVVKSGGILVKTVNAEGNVDYLSTLSGGIAELANLQIAINANGNVTYTGPNYNTVISTRGTATLVENGNVQTLTALGDVSLTGTWWVGVQGTLTGGSNFSYVNGNVAYAGSVRGTISPTPKADDTRIKVKSDTALNVSVSEVKVADINFPVPTASRVDVYTLKDSANYAFTYEEGKRKVTVKDVSGVADGVYFLGSVRRGQWKEYTYPDFLCTSVDSNGTCDAKEWDSAQTLCQGFSAQNGCISYDTKDKKWSVNGQTLAPGLVWFDSDLNLSSGTYFNTFAVAGNINTSGSTLVYAPNYAGYGVVCSDTDIGNYTIPGKDKPVPLTRDSRLTGMYPKQFCDFDKKQYISKSVGNAALIAGGYLDSTTYVGGLINLSAKNEVFGNVLSGDRLTTGGATTIHGSILVSGLGTTTDSNGNRENGWSGKTIIDLRTPPSTFNSDENVCMDLVNGCDGGKVTEDPKDPPGATNQARVFWTSYR